MKKRNGIICHVRSAAGEIEVVRRLGQAGGHKDYPVDQVGQEAAYRKDCYRADCPAAVASGEYDKGTDGHAGKYADKRVPISVRHFAEPLGVCHGTATQLVRSAASALGATPSRQVLL
ncbi:MAG: hypothetical protein GY788_15695 [bacterium]|nr:hypothetical protein [bacterium]